MHISKFDKIMQTGNSRRVWINVAIVEKWENA